MSLMAYKYTPGEMPDGELEATFAARRHTVDFLLKSLRDQIPCSTLSSFLITGPRGAGKSTVIRMVALCLRRDPELSSSWIPIVFPEEQFQITSLRDLLAATLRKLAEQGIVSAQNWLNKTEEESDEEQSKQLAITGIRQVTLQLGKRLILFVENLNQLMEECLNDQEKGTLRRLLMIDPFMMFLGSAVHPIDALERYDQAFFNYFHPVPLDRLDVEQVFELLRLRADFDGNRDFLHDFREQRAKIRTITHLSGGNPRLVLMLYELLSRNRITTIVQCLRCLVDELTPLLKNVMESLPPQQRKIVHALMERGGTAQPTDLAAQTRLPLNAINTQLKRLKEARIIEVLGGGKGRAAHYTIPDKLFAIWYQMRYLNRNRRRIELFVEILRVWFEAEERFSRIRSFSRQKDAATPNEVHEVASNSNYVITSLTDTVEMKYSDQTTAKLGDLLTYLSSQEKSEGWIHAARWLLERQTPEVKQALSFLEPLCGVLEDGEISLLDPLPPEQREFALQVLARFQNEEAFPVDYSGTNREVSVSGSVKPKVRQKGKTEKRRTSPCKRSRLSAESALTSSTG